MMAEKESKQWRRVLPHIEDRTAWRENELRGMNRRPEFRSVLSLTFAAGILLLLNPHAPCQSPGNSSPEEPHRHDGWMTVPMDPPAAPTDHASLQILDKRGNAFDHFHEMICGTGIPLDQPQKRESGGGCGFSLDYGVQPELPFFPDEAIVVARFSGYESFITPSRLTIYTSIKLSVEQVLEAGPTAVKPGDTIEDLIYGGTIALGKKIIQEGIYQDSAYTLQPGHRYVLFLRYEDSGKYFINEKSWELVDGSAVPNHAIEVTRMQQGKAQYSGLPEKAFIDAVQNAILEHENRNDSPGTTQSLANH
jgi:hypothetical protein